MIVLDPVEAPWSVKAACKGADPDLFFPVAYDDPRILDAKEICRTCPVNEDCLEFAISTRERFGIWGGHTEAERGRIARSRRAQP